MIWHKNNAVLALAALCAFAFGIFISPVRAAERPNIIFVMADDLGYGDLGCYGQQRIQTPTIDALAREGMRFTDFYAGSTVCAPSRCVLMTGLHAGHAFIRGNARENLRPEDVTVAEVLQAAGYATGLIGKWGLGHEGSDGVPTRQGFDYFFGYLDQHHAHNYYPVYLMRGEERFPLNNIVPGEGPFGSGVATEKVQYSHDLMAQEVLDFIDRNKDRPFFLYLAYTIPHANNEAGEKGMEVPDYGPYADLDWPEPQKGHAAMITRMDVDLGRMLARLKEYGLDEKTIIFFTSDNGPHAEGGADPTFNRSSDPLRGIKRSLHDGGIRVPMIVRRPGKIAPGTTSDFIGGFQDVMPTLAELAGAAEAVPERIDGVSFAPTLLGKPDEQNRHEYLYWTFYEQGGGQAMRMGPWKAVQQPIHSPIRLFNLRDDIGEQNDLAGQNPDLVEQMKQKMDAACEPSPRWKFPEPKPPQPAEAEKPQS